MRLLLVALALLALPAAAQDAPATPPDWAREAVWYQIFPERFRNGDPTNDPTPERIAGSWPHVETARLREAGWAPTPWTHDWYEQEDWAQRLGADFYTTVQLRRYGGDLQGILDALPYLDSLGVTALYINPLNDAPSLHKFDARMYRHVDPNFGPDPEGDLAIIAEEDPTDPATWRFTAADSLFLDVIAAAHARDMRVVLDYSWNHTGITFWAWRDVLARGEASPFANWYEIEAFDDPATPDTNEFAYTGWAGVAELPEWKKTDLTGDPHAGIPLDGNLHPEVRDLVFAVTRRWLDPDGDGDPSDGLDGFRLDVAEQVPLGFWRDYHAFVKSINPEAYLVGEIWWQQWPDVMMDPRPYLGDVFDGVMNYRWFAPARRLFAGAVPPITPSEFVRHIDSLRVGIPPATEQALMNISASHDSPRLGTSLFNPDNRYKHQANPREDPDYRVGRPDEAARRAQRLLLLYQFTTPGAPQIYYGDEVGMWGADDPDNRRPMVWADLEYEVEDSHPLGRPRAPEAVAPDSALHAFYRDLIGLRRAHSDLFSEGSFEWLMADDGRGLLAYRRQRDGGRATVIFNLSPVTRTLDLTTDPIRLGVGAVGQVGDRLTLGPKSGAVLIY